MKAIVVMLSLVASIATQAQVANSCYRGNVDGKSVKLNINRGASGITHGLTVGEHGVQGNCFRVSQALAMYCTSGTQTMAFGLEYLGQSATLQVLGSLMLSHPVRVQDHIILQEGTSQGIISLTSVDCE